MTIKLGNDYMLWVETATPGAYVIVDGQGNLTRNRSRSGFSVANKASAFDGQRMGLPKTSIQLEIIPDLPSTGFDRLENMVRAEPQVPFNIQIRKGGTSGNGNTDLVYAQSVVSSGVDDGADMGGPVTLKTTLEGAAAPTTDKLA